MVSVKTLGGNKLFMYGERRSNMQSLISAIKAWKCIFKGWEYFIVYVLVGKKEKKKLEDVRIVWDFLTYIPDELPDLPPPRQVEFRIDLVLGATPIALTLYRLDPT
ncbi:hypothetical protein L2E82_44504 [Cichorium intybus]|uniref:Uncharacterized protein n=1 Tax=Cichorium intybus TaxID=13427 RepID=A0ACB8ZQP7_CICIN|nr:hypothetical protein L2E82_44504 [Cichorium intybus]